MASGRPRLNHRVPMPLRFCPELFSGNDAGPAVLACEISGQPPASFLGKRRTLMPPAPTARQVALDLLSAVLRRKRPLDDAIEDNPDMPVLSVRDRAFARLLVATVLRRLGQIDALIADCLNTPLAPRAAIVQDILRLGISQLMFLRTPPHAAVATSVDLAHQRGLLSHKGLVNAVLRRLSVEGAERVERQDAARLNTPDWLWHSWSGAYGDDMARAIATAHLKEAPLDLTVRADEAAWCERLQATQLPTGSLRRPAGAANRSEEHTSELQSRFELVCRRLLENKTAARAVGWSCIRTAISPRYRPP